MEKLNIYAFADEASGQIDGQIAAMRRNGLQGLEIRGVDGQNIADISLEKAHEVRRKLDDAGLTVWSMGSPIGKTGIGSDGFAAHLDKLRHVLALADVLGAKNVRMFSFYMPAEQAEKYRQQVIDQVGQMLRVAEGSGIALCHENEKGIYGDNAARCHDLLTVFPQLEGIFDPANFIQCGQDTIEAWKLLRERIKYLHIKDALESGKVIDQMGQMLRVAEGSGVALCHENEKGIYGDMADRCLDLLNTFPQLEGIFDPANFIQCGQDTIDAWKLLRGRIKYLHIKDALENGKVVPAGKGEGNVRIILDDFRARGGCNVTIEPHLSVFAGLKDLERAGEETKIDPFCYESSDAAFDAACNALKALL